MAEMTKEESKAFDDAFNSNKVADVVTMLKQHPERATQTEDNVRNTIANYAATLGRTEMLQAILKEHPELATQKNIGGYTIAHHAAATGQTKTLEAILKEHPELATQTDIVDNTIAHLAAAGGHTTTLQAILKEHPELATQKNVGGYTIAHLAAANNQTETLQAILKEHPKLAMEKADDGRTIAHLAAGWAPTEMLQAILKEHPELATQKDNNGKTPHDSLPARMGATAPEAPKAQLITLERLLDVNKDGAVDKKDFAAILQNATQEIEALAKGGVQSDGREHTHNDVKVPVTGGARAPETTKEK